MWINKCDQLPADNEYVLVYPPYCSPVFPDEPRHVLRYGRGRFEYYLGGSVHNAMWKEITHWMPLPAPLTADNVEVQNNSGVYSGGRSTTNTGSPKLPPFNECISAFFAEPCCESDPRDSRLLSRFYDCIQRQLRAGA